MITLQDSAGRFVFEIKGSNEFHLSHADMVEVLDRQRLRELHALFQTALNTSAEEIEAPL